MKQIKGQSYNINGNIIGKVTSKNNLFLKDKVLVTDKVPKSLLGVSALILKKSPERKLSVPVFISSEIDLNENDIVNITENGLCNVIWEANATHNAIFVTDTCNSKCIMCPQPIPENPKNYFNDNIKLIKLLDKKVVKSIGITGGEPTLNIKQLSNLLNLINERFNNIPVHMLTNGRTLAESKNLNLLVNTQNDITFGIPLYSNVEDEHDYIVGCKGAFNETIKGLYNLAKAQQKVEIRIVVMKQNYNKLIDIAEFIYRNLPFVVHVAIMTMEYTGLAKENFDNIFIDPVNYQQELLDAVRQFVRYDIPVSIYNTPLCLLDKRIWALSADSISDWKKTYTPSCEKCIKKMDCGGVFNTSFIQSSNIIAIQETECKV